MAKIHTVLLASGGLRSMVAGGSLPRGGVAWLYVHDGRASDRHHRQAFVHQAEHFEASYRSELSLPHLRPARSGEEHPAPLVELQMLTIAAGEAVRLGAGKLVWSVTAGDQFDLISRITETIVLLEHAVKLESGVDLTIDTPMLDLTLKQVIEAGEQMSLAWRMARSCRAESTKPCGVCSPCEQRRRAFALAHVDDPLEVTSEAGGAV